MDIGLLHAAALGVVLIAIDIASRSLRIMVFLAAFESRLPFGKAFASTLFTDAASVVTPMRAGGGPARYVSMRAGGISARTAAAALAMDLSSYYLVVGCISLLLLILLAPGSLDLPLPDTPVGIAALATAAALVVAVLLRTQLPRRLVRKVVAPLTFSPRNLVRTLLLTLPLALLSMCCRLAVLPIFLMTRPEAGKALDLVAWSIALTYGQNFMPTPAGAGVVEAALGGAGGLDAAYVVWRGVTVGTVALAGFGVALSVYGRTAVTAVLRGRVKRAVVDGPPK
jgi:uncharacterized membrane protein YbhN (UPF0104 family)